MLKAYTLDGEEKLMVLNFDVDKINNIVFDVGSILIGYRWEDMFSDNGIDPDIALAVGRGLFDSPNWKLFDAGLIGTKELVDRFCEVNPHLEEEARWFIKNAIQMRVLRPKVYDEVSRLKAKGYKLYILSNYSYELYELHTADLPFRKIMDGELVSYMIHELKPDKAIYEELINRFSLNPSETVFFDDRLENVKGAEALGINGIHIENESEELLLEYLRKF